MEQSLKLLIEIVEIDETALAFVIPFDLRTAASVRRMAKRQQSKNFHKLLFQLLSVAEVLQDKAVMLRQKDSNVSERIEMFQACYRMMYSHDYQDGNRASMQPIPAL